MTKETKRFRENYSYEKYKGEVNNLPSQTIPNEALSIREILVRYSRGLPIDGKIPIYDEENDLPDPRKMDLADWETMQIEAREEVQRIKSAHEKQLQVQQEAKTKKLKEYEEFQEFLKKQSQNQSNQQSTQQSTIQ